jgi:hypothetical protein
MSKRTRQGNRYYAKIQNDALGGYATKLKAVLAYDLEALRRRGKHAHLNVIVPRPDAEALRRALNDGLPTLFIRERVPGLGATGRYYLICQSQDETG